MEKLLQQQKNHRLNYEKSTDFLNSIFFEQSILLLKAKADNLSSNDFDFVKSTKIIEHNHTIKCNAEK